MEYIFLGILEIENIRNLYYKKDDSLFIKHIDLSTIPEYERLSTKYYHILNNTENIFLATKEECEEFALWLNSPWSYTTENYKIEFNCVNNESSPSKKLPEYRCLYTIIGYEGITSIIIGYGNEPNIALEDCISKFNYIQELYNKDDECV